MLRKCVYGIHHFCWLTVRGHEQQTAEQSQGDTNKQERQQGPMLFHFVRGASYRRQRVLGRMLERHPCRNASRLCTGGCSRNGRCVGMRSSLGHLLYPSPPALNE